MADRVKKEEFKAKYQPPKEYSEAIDRVLNKPETKMLGLIAKYQNRCNEIAELLGVRDSQILKREHAVLTCVIDDIRELLDLPTEKGMDI